jgi:hypothetical protein
MPRKKKSAEQTLVLTERNPYTSLTILQRQYVEARLQGLTKSAASRAAGIPPQQGSLYEKNPRVREAIRYLIKESTKSVDELTKSDVLTGMMDAVNASATASELVMAWREVGKLLGHYEPERKILEIHDYSKDELKTLSDEDLLRLSGGKIRDAIEDAEYEELPSTSAH